MRNFISEAEYSTRERRLTYEAPEFKGHAESSVDSHKHMAHQDELVTTFSPSEKSKESLPQSVLDSTDIQTLASVLLQKNPATSVDHLLCLKEYVQNARSHVQGFEAGSPECEKSKSVVALLESTIAQQIEINGIMGNVDPAHGAVFCIPGQGIMCSGIFTEFFGEKPIKDVETFRSQFKKLQSQFQEKAEQILRESALKMQLALSEISEQVQNVISREKSVISGAIQDREYSGWFGKFVRTLTSSNPYQIEINAARQKVSTMQDVCIPLMQEAEAALHAIPPALERARDLIAAVSRVRKTTNKVDMDTSHFELEQAAINLTETVTISGIVALATLGVGGGAAVVGRVGWQGAKLGLTGLKYLIVGTAVAGGVSEVIRDDKPTTESEEDVQKIDDITTLTGLPLALQLQAISSKILDQIPDELSYTYSQDLFLLATEKSQMIAGLLLSYVSASDVEKKDAILAQIFTAMYESSADLLQQFLDDNADPTTCHRFHEARMNRTTNDTLGIGNILGHLSILEPLSRGDQGSAREAAVAYVQKHMLGVQEQDVPPASTQKIIQDMASCILVLTESQTYPLLVQAIQNFSKSGFSTNLQRSVRGVSNFVGDVVTAPFNEKASGRIRQSSSIIKTLLSQGKVDEIVTGLISFSRTACNISLDHVQAFDLLESIGGVVALNAIIIAGTAGAGMVIKTGQATGKISSTTSNIVRTGVVGVNIVKHGKAPFSVLSKLTLAGLHAKILEKSQ